MEQESVLTERQGEVLMAIVRAYVDTAEPIGSHTVVSEFGLEVSPATVRNEMAALEELGYLISPHTSAGRIPTEKAYQYYVRNFLRPIQLSKKEQQDVRSILAALDAADTLRRAAKVVAEYSSESVFLALNKNEIYYTGLTNLFAQPEFRTHDQLTSMGVVFDHFDEIINRVFDEIPRDTAVLVGSDNPFGKGCSVIVTRYEHEELGSGLFGILGPMRMNYDANVARIRFVNDMISRLV